MGQRTSCLVVEDSPVMRELIVFALSRIPDLCAREADDGLAAMRLLAQERFDLVITDINMPMLDGLKLIGHIRADPTHRSVPILVLTSEDAGEERERALESGATAYITKPVRSTEVVAKVSELLLRSP